MVCFTCVSVLKEANFRHFFPDYAIILSIAQQFYDDLGYTLAFNGESPGLDLAAIYIETDLIPT